MKRHGISEEDLIKKYKKSNKLFHLAKTPINDKNKSLIKIHPQLLVMGYNAGGRPDGLWISKGTTWLSTAKSISNPKYPTCCYLYEIVLKQSANILEINSQSDYEKFNKEFPDYWINMDYFEVDFLDYLHNKPIKTVKRYKLVLSKLRKKPGEKLRDTLIQNNIIFTNSTDAWSKCEFYRTIGIPIERFKFKDWSAVAAKYQGIMFNIWDINNKKLMYDLWFQSLDVASGCIWDITAIENVKLLYHKNDKSTWVDT